MQLKVVGKEVKIIPLQHDYPSTLPIPQLQQQSDINKDWQ